jgi:hypothetical protein
LTQKYYTPPPSGLNEGEKGKPVPGNWRESHHFENSKTEPAANFKIGNSVKWPNEFVGFEDGVPTLIGV